MKTYNVLLQAQFDKMCKTGKLFRSQITGSKVWELYINGFEDEHDPIFRDPNSSSHNCNLCNNFIRRYGNIVALDKDLNIITMFDVDGAPDEYKSVSEQITKELKAAGISEVFFETLNEWLELITTKGKADGIVSIFMCPKYFFDNSFQKSFNVNVE
jgi:hypothetical protein